MPVLKESGYAAEIVWLGRVPAGESLRAEPVQKLDLSFAGVAGEQHEGDTRPSCVRVRNLYPEGTEIRNTRQLSVLSEEEMKAIASEMGMAELNPSHLGASLVVKGIPDFTHVPPASRLLGPDGVALTIDIENRPCVFPGREIEADHPGHGPSFKPAAAGRRGVTAWVERPGRLKLGDSLTLFIPDQRAWQP
ncbi:MOSC domain-containing protein [Primorskyibacter sp. S87]|uniref:MOSC domain-containing protein n=1 Tax=Primorskyibacter sp. S87 TaxID=3415126 RepID=UPI003C7975DA